ncbi:nitrous oxide reductase accessory protein NosL [Geobacter sp. AOG2]|uniref:nitrous oxide reductase accessory protein NosL n=1 Tax=Geobacter sp. AOG2 TaxID=1566347 RepID=UPI001CC5E063|nr:nitrous oxide reductase accessory protein NosL [Geobacter sp. AOG2]GFE61163.1 NosL family protein [Geobacter sp. AOG2]
MKKHLGSFFIMISIALAASSAMSTEHQHGEHQQALTADSNAPADVKLHGDCAYCGMNRGKFAHSRMLITYADGKSTATCSIHCAAIDLKNSKGAAIKSVQVGDFNTKVLIDAEKAFWVIGGDRRGVMTKTPKWAFAEKTAAEAFIKDHGGKLATYHEALSLAEKDGGK